ncbi:hypothetical protein THRCLA_10196, partial [Thraustotheca clavata]
MGGSSSVDKAVVLYQNNDCTGSVLYTNLISTMPDGSTLSTCKSGFSGRVNPLASQYLPDNLYATITIPDVGSTEEVIDNVCLPISPANDIYVKTSCKSSDFAYYTDKNCTQVMELQASSVGFSCAVPNPVMWPLTSTLVGQTTSNTNCTGSVVYALNVGTGGIPYNVPLPQTSLSPTCHSGLIYNKTIHTNEFIFNQTYMTIARTYMTEVALDQVCVFVGDKYLKTSCATNTFDYFFDAQCAKQVVVNEIGAVASLCSVIFTNTSITSTPTSTTTGGSGGTVATIVFSVLVGSLFLSFLISRRGQDKAQK